VVHLQRQLGARIDDDVLDLEALAGVYALVRGVTRIRDLLTKA